MNEEKLQEIIENLVKQIGFITNNTPWEKIYLEKVFECFAKPETLSEQCECELDGFQGAISTYKCKFHKPTKEII